ncbi:4-hydroxy-tetrahydrodipicolinate reductase [Candidatus Woesearchaeota archaeon]|nr:4-hydroxy-tetrahydrodipicolinate reductase [Candidatus Woesearchaeota archaeon]
MKIAIIGYGKMGREVERLAKARGIEVTSIIDPSEKTAFHLINPESLKNADVAIDFTQPDSALDNIKAVAAAKKNLVMATTGWHDKMDEAKSIVKKSGTGMIYSSNFSIGVNAYFRIVEEAAKVFNRLEEYDAYAYELHHNQKKDSPSGTAKTIAQILTGNISRKKKALYDRLDRQIEAPELHVASIRAGSIPGTHVVGFDSEADTIEIKHTARNRSGFAAGALMAAEWIQGRKGFFTMADFMQDYFRK